jgi:hypothetical protein
MSVHVFLNLVLNIILSVLYSYYNVYNYLSREYSVKLILGNQILNNSNKITLQVDVSF